MSSITQPMEAPMRIQKFLSSNGACSRRAAEAAIREGHVQVNGEIAHIGQVIDAKFASVTYCGETVAGRHSRPFALALHKPRGYVCTHRDPHCPMEQTIYALLPLHRSHKLICCGRLDKDSEGLVILTNSGELAAKLSHPSGGLKKYYRVSLSVPLNEQHRKKMLAGVTCDGEVLRAQGIEFSEKSHRRPHITLEEGRKRHIRRMMEAFGYEIQRLERYRIGQFSMGTIRPGRHMELTDEHLRKLQCN